MRRSHLSFLAATFMSVFVLFACSDGSDPQGQPDSGPVADTAVGKTSAKLKGVKAYDSLKGTAQLEVEVQGTPTKVELLSGSDVVATADSAPFTLSWDTTGQKDGIVELKVRCDGDDTMTSEAVKLVVLNKGSEATFTDGTGADIAVPKDSPYVDQHLKHHWTMGAGITRVIGVLYWDDQALELELAIGMGTCPHSGTKAADVKGKTGAIGVEYGTGQALTEGKWFAHVDLVNKTDDAVKGKTVPYTVKAYLLVD